MSITTSIIFVDGICEVGDETLRSHFQKFGSKISSLRTFRRQSTENCCSGYITFTSVHTANAVMRHRPHQIENNPIFVKRLHSANEIHVTPEQLVPITRLIFKKSADRDVKEQTIEKFFKQFGSLIRLEIRREENRLLVQFEDYDSVDRLLIEKDHRFCGIELDPKCLTDAVAKRPYFGVCRRKAEIKPLDEKPPPPKVNVIQQYETTFRKKNEELAQYRLLLKKKNDEFLSLQHDYEVLQKKFSELEKKDKSSCSTCQQHQATIARLKQGIIELNDSYETIQSRYQELLSSRSDTLPVQTRKLRLSTRLNIDESKLDSVVARFPSRRNPSDQVVTSNTNEFARQRPFTPQDRIRYPYESVSHSDQ